MGTAASLRPAVRFPVALLVGIQYVALAVFPALINSNPFLPFILAIVAVGLLTSVLAEWLCGIVRRRDIGKKAIRYPGPLGVWVITCIGAVALVVSTWLGARTYATQVLVTNASPLTTLLTPLQPWVTVGCAFALASWRVGRLSRRAAILIIAVGLGAQLVSAVWIARLAPVMDFAFCLGAGLLLIGFIHLRWLFIGFAVAVLLWPTLYAARNATRSEVLGLASQSTVDAASRLRDDLLLQQAAIYGDSFTLPQPSAVDIVRFGLIPRAFDPGRGSLPGGSTLSVALGSTSTSSSTFTVLGTIWSLDGGYLGVVLYLASIAIVFSFVARRLTPVRLAMAMLVVYELLWIESTYPDNVAALLQGLASLFVAWVVVVPLGTLRKRQAVVTLQRRSDSSFLGEVG